LLRLFHGQHFQRYYIDQTEDGCGGDGDVIVPGILEAGDVADVASGLAPRPLLLQGLVDGRDRLVRAEDLESELAPVYEAYRGPSSRALSIRGGENASHFADWFLTHLSGGAGNSPSSSGGR